LIISGNPTDQELSDQWEKIIQENGKHTNDHKYDIYQELVYDYGLLIAQHTVVSVCLEMLFVGNMANRIDPEIIKEVRERGYKIDTTPTAFEKSLQSAKSKCKNLITKAESKRKDIERQFKDKGDKKEHTYDEIIGFLELALDRTVMDSETLTLAKYNVLKRGAEQRHEQRKKNGANSDRRARV